MTNASNPWITREADPAPAPAVVTEGPPPATGPVGPQGGVPAPDGAVLDVRDVAGPAALWTLGVHGGAGESSLAALVADWQASGHSWPRVPGSRSVPVLLVARTSAHGLLAARVAATQWASGLVPQADVLGLVLVADAPGRLPRELRDLAGVISGGVPRTWSVPWIESWRRGQSPTVDGAPGAVRRLVDDLHQLIPPRAVGAPL